MNPMPVTIEPAPVQNVFDFIIVLYFMNMLLLRRYYWVVFHIER